MSRNTTNRLESNPGHLHWIRGLQQIKVIGEWHFVKSVYAFHLWRVKHMNFLAEVYLICGFWQGWDILLYESPRRKPGWRFTAGFHLKRSDLRQTLPAQPIEIDWNEIFFPDGCLLIPECDSEGFFPSFKAFRSETNLAGTTDWNRLKSIEVEYFSRMAVY